MNNHLLTIEKFFSEALNDIRKIRVLLPPGYSSRTSHQYPVLYVHDAQNLFDDRESYSGQAWHLDRIVTDLITTGQIQPIILVAIDHGGGHRLAEFAHQDRNHEGQHIRARGNHYETFLSEELKPRIDRMFHTHPEARGNALMGSSMGGLVSLNIALRRSDQFGAVAALSPSCWWNPAALKSDLKQFSNSLRQLKIWLDIGGREGDYGDDVEEIATKIAILSGNDIDMLRYYLEPDADHSENAWRNRVHLPLKFLFGIDREK